MCNIQCENIMKRPISYVLLFIQMIITMVVVFNVVWSPYALLAFTTIVNPGAVPEWAYTFPTMFGEYLTSVI